VCDSLIFLAFICVVVRTFCPGVSHFSFLDKWNRLSDSLEWMRLFVFS